MILSDTPKEVIVASMQANNGDIYLSNFGIYELDIIPFVYQGPSPYTIRQNAPLKRGTLSLRNQKQPSYS